MSSSNSGRFLSVPIDVWQGKNRIKGDTSTGSVSSTLSLNRSTSVYSDARSLATSDDDRDCSTCGSRSEETLQASSFVSVSVVDTAEKPLLKQRVQWDNKAQFVLSLISYAVGLGNIWRFPYLCQENGGGIRTAALNWAVRWSSVIYFILGAFLIPYTISMLILGVPLFYLELGVGQRFRCGPIGAWNGVHPYLGGVGISSAVISFLIGLYYNVIIAWCLFYFFHSFQGPLPWATCPLGENTTQVLECQLSSETSYFWYREAVKSTESMDHLGGINWKMASALTACWVIVFLCVMKGIKSSGYVMCFTAIFPYFVLTIFFIRTMMLDGAMLGLKYMFTPNFGKLTEPKVWLDGATQVFFSFGLGFGGLIAFASYNHPKNDCRLDTLIVSFANWITAVYATVVVYAVIGFKATVKHTKCVSRNVNTVLAFFPNFFNSSTPVMSALKSSLHWSVIQGHVSNESQSLSLTVCDLKQELNEAAGGTGLAFITFTQAMLEFPGAPFWAALFFLMLLCLGLGSMFGTLEGVITSFVDTRITERVRKEIMIGSICLVSLITGFIFVTEAGHYWVQLFDTYSGSFSLIIVALLEVLAISYVYGCDRFCADMKLMTGHTPSWYWRWSWRFIAPLTMSVIFGASVIGVFLRPPSYQAYNQAKAKTVSTPLPTCAIVVASLVVLVTTLPIPIVAMLEVFRGRVKKFHRIERPGNEPGSFKLTFIADSSPGSSVTVINADSGRGSLEDIWVTWPDWMGWQQSLGLMWYCLGGWSQLYPGGCVYNWANATTVQKFTLAFLIIAVLLSLGGLAAGVVACFRHLQYFVKPVLILSAALACAAVLTALIVWGVNMERNMYIGYSLWCAIIADIVLLTAVFVALVLISCTKITSRSFAP